ncbi:asialoglycoprotein receptor 2-like isoform X2 [Crassostrea virginica]
MCHIKIRTCLLVRTSLENLFSDLESLKGCDDDWIEYGGHCYFIGPSKVTWEEAKAACLGVCSHLVEIDSKEESEWLANTFLNKSTCAGLWFDCTSWTGGNDLQTEGHYKWDWSDSTLTFTNWQVTEPSLGDPDLADRKDCIDVMRDGRWNDRQCHYLNSYICEKRII